MSKKIAVVTALIGAYDSQLLEFEYDTSKYEFICYTNMTRLKSNTWDIRYVDDLEVPTDNAKSAYYYKWNPHKYLAKSKHETMIWVDSSFTSIDMDEIDLMVEEFKSSGKSIYIEKHPSRSTLASELEMNSKLIKDDVDKMKNQVERYFKEGYREEYTRMVETGLTIRKYNNIDIINVSETIWSEISPLENTKRDQLVWDYAVWKNNFYDYAFFSYERKLKAITFQDHPHRSNHKDKVLVVGPWFGEEQYEKSWVRFVAKYLAKTPVDSVVVGCRPGKESLYDSLSPDRVIATDPEGTKRGNLLDDRVPRFNIKSSDNKEIIRLDTSHDDFVDVDKKTHIIWATIRADEFDEKFGVWLDRCDHPEKIIPHIGVDNEEDKKKIKSVPPECVAVNPPPRKGVCYPGYMLSSKVESDNDQDLVIFGSDDFEPVDHWDTLLYKEFTTYNGSLLVDDTCEPIVKDIMTIPIMTYYTLCKLNKIIYHPAYSHCWSDNELLYNLEEMDLVRDIRISKPYIWFKHNHYVNGGRKQDEADKTNELTHYTGKSLWGVRKQLPLDERLKYDPNEPLLSILILTLVEREDKLNNLLSILEPQLTDQVEVIIERDNRESPVGKKRNNALHNANGRYICFIDDDDMVSEDYVERILSTIGSVDVDCCSLKGEINLNILPTGTFIHSLKYMDWSDRVISGEDDTRIIEYYRPPNHLNVVRRDIAIYVGFNDDMSIGEDKDYSIRLRDHLTSEAPIDNILYYYDAKSEE